MYIMTTLYAKPKKSTKFEDNVKEITGMKNTKDAINSIIYISYEDLKGRNEQCVCGTWCTSKIYLYQVLSKPESALMIGDACRKKYLHKKKRHICKNVNNTLLKNIINIGEKDIDLELHQIQTWALLVGLGRTLNMDPIKLTENMETIQTNLNEQGCKIPSRLLSQFDICKFKKSQFYRKQDRFKHRTFEEHQKLIATQKDLAEEFDLGYFTLWVKTKNLDKNYETDYKYEYKINKSLPVEIITKIRDNLN